MKALIHPSTVSGTIEAPVSKSAMQRACAAALIRRGRTVIVNPGFSNDDKAAIDIISALGATVQHIDQCLVVESNGIKPVNNIIHCGESGLSLRMFTPLAAMSSMEMTITGSGSLLSRPMDLFDVLLPQLKVRCRTTKGRLPIVVRGPMVPVDIHFNGSLSSQYLTGLLFAYAATESNATISVGCLTSRPYIDLTLQVLQDFRLPLPVNHDYHSFSFSNVDFHEFNGDLEYSVEGDWSGAAFLLVAGAIYGGVTVSGLKLYSRQADKVILEVLEHAGADITVGLEKITVEKSQLKAFHFNATNCPDLFPPLVALACYCEGVSIIEGVSRLRHKESDRAITLQEEFGSIGISIELRDDLMLIRPGRMKPTRTLQSHHDHRIAMALAITAIGMKKKVEIMGAEAVDKSYPQFWDHLSDIGASITLVNANT